jgi:hypothetical protein
MSVRKLVLPAVALLSLSSFGLAPRSSATAIDCSGCTIEPWDYGLPEDYEQDFQVIWIVRNPNPGVSLANLAPSSWGAVSSVSPYVSPSSVSIPANDEVLVTGYYRLGDSASCSALCGGAVMTITNSGTPPVYAKVGIPRP